MTQTRQVIPTTQPPHFATLLVMALAPEQVGKRIRQARKAKGWTHQQLADEMGVGLRTAQRWQEGRSPTTGKSWLPPLARLMELAEVLGVQRSWFVEDDAPVPADEASALRQEIANLEAQSRERDEEILRLLRELRPPQQETDG